MLEKLGPNEDVRPSIEASRMVRDGAVDTGEADELHELAEAAEDERYAAQLLQIGTAVRERAGGDVFVMTLLDGRSVQIPRAPFTRWALSRVPGIDLGRLPTWDPISPSGIKMCNDDRCHTDWVLGAGLSIEDSYTDNVSRPAWAAAAEMQFAEVDDE